MPHTLPGMYPSKQSWRKIIARTKATMIHTCPIVKYMSTERDRFAKLPAGTQTIHFRGEK